MSLKIYKKKLDYSYTFGIFPTIELLTHMPDKVMTVLIQDEKINSEGIEKVKKLCDKHRINYDFSPIAISKLASKENTQVIGVFRKYVKALQKETAHVILVNPSDMGNVGTIIRTMVGFGITNLVLIRPAVDIFDPRVVRSSMGSIFLLNFEYFNSFDHYTEKYGDSNVYPFVLGGKEKLSNVKFEKPAKLVFGNEGEGLPEIFNKYKTIEIDHSDKIDSLNLAISAGIGLYKYSL